MGYFEALKAAGAKLLASSTFGSYQGDWFAKVVYQGRTFWVHGSYGSCSYCDAFQSEFDYAAGDTCDEHKYEGDSPESKACEACKAAPATYQAKLAAFGLGYLTSGDMTQAEAEALASRNLEWDEDATEMLTFVQANAI
jgi:hypothetical protein